MFRFRPVNMNCHETFVGSSAGRYLKNYMEDFCIYSESKDDHCHEFST